jgi:hypothetical protein
MTECVNETPVMPSSVADAWAAVYIDVGEKLDAADGDDKKDVVSESEDKEGQQ